MICIKKQKDTYGFLLRSLISGVLIYTEVIQPYWEVSNALLLLGVLLAGLTILDMSGIYGFLRFPIPTKPFSFILIYVVATFYFGIIVSPNLSVHINKAINIIEYTVVAGCILYYCHTRNDSTSLAKLFVFIAVAMGVSFIVRPQIYMDTIYGVRYSYSSSTNPNDFAMILAVGIWAVLYFVSKKRLNTIIGIVVCAVLVYAEIGTGSRKGMIGILICLLLWIVFCFLPLSKNNSGILGKAYRLIVVIFGISVVVVYYLPKLSDSTLILRFIDFSKDQSNLNRLSMYKEGLELLFQSPIFGYGFEGFRCFKGYYSHSTIVEVFVSSGIPLALIYFWAYINIAFELLKARAISRFNKDYDMEVQRRMTLILLSMMAFYAVCVIHIYDLPSFYYFGMIIVLLEEIKSKSELQEDSY